MSAAGSKGVSLVVVSLLSFALTLMVHLSGVLAPLEFAVYDLATRYLNPDRGSAAVVLIEIDQKSIEALGAEGVQWPWPRRRIAALVEYLSEAEAVFIDMPFHEPSPYGPEDDLFFAEVCKRALNVYLPVSLLRRQGDLERADEEFVGNIALRDSLPAAGAFRSVLAPIDPLKDAVVGSGGNSGLPDADGVHRSVPLLFRLNDTVVPHVVVSHLIRKGLVATGHETLLLRGSPLQLRQGEHLVRYYRSAAPLVSLSALEVLRPSHSDVAGAAPEQPRERSDFKGKMVVIGVTAPGAYEPRPTPVNPRMPPALLHATALDSLVAGTSLRRVDDAYLIALLLLLSLPGSVAAAGRHSLLKTVAVILVLGALSLGLSALLFAEGLYLHITAPLVGIAISAFVSGLYGSLTTGRERLLIKKSFAGYMNSERVAYLAQNPSLLSQGGAKRAVIVLCAEIAPLPPGSGTAEAAQALRQALAAAVVRNNGVVEKGAGELFRAFWGAPFYALRDEKNACSAALECREAVKELNASRKADGLLSLSLGIGLHAGEALVGNPGTDMFPDYAVWGEAAESAALITSLATLFKIVLVVSEEALKKTGDLFLTRELGRVELPGRETPLSVFELLGERTSVPPEERAAAADFERALTLYRELKWHAAARLFRAVLAKFPDDGPSLFYNERCEQLIENPKISEGWDVITVAKTADYRR